MIDFKIKHSMLCIFSIAIAGILGACEEGFEEETYSLPHDDFGKVFDDFWDQMNRNYVFWDIDKTDWDLTYRKYRPIFEKLDFADERDVRKSVGYFREMTSNFIDFHYHIRFEHVAIRDSVVYPSLAKKLKEPGFHYPLAYAAVDTAYLHDFVFGYDSISRPNSLKYALSGMIDQNILFFYCNELSMFESYTSKKDNEVRKVLDHFLGIMGNSQDNLRGIIVDLRGNAGGHIQDLHFFLGHFVQNPFVFGATRYRTGSSRLDFTPWIDAKVAPVNPLKSQIPVIVLVDNFTASIAEILAIAISGLPNGILIGETTWGATGLMAPSELYNSGSFSIEGFMSVTASAVQFRFLDGNSYEGIGFPPDVEVPANRDSLFEGVDVQLERAISLIRQE